MKNKLTLHKGAQKRKSHTGKSIANEMMKKKCQTENVLRNEIHFICAELENKKKNEGFTKKYTKQTEEMSTDAYFKRPPAIEWEGMKTENRAFEWSKIKCSESMNAKCPLVDFIIHSFLWLLHHYYDLTIIQ